MIRLRESTEGRRVSFLRHGESLHKVKAEQSGRVCRCDDLDPNVRTTEGCPWRDPALMDAPLTDEGRALVRGLGANEHVELVLASTSVRALETAVEAFPGIPLVALESLRSRVSGHMHTKRRTLAELAARFPTARMPDGDDEDTLWNGATETRASMDQRVQRFLAELLARPERHIAVVTHFTIFLALLARNSDALVIGTNPHRPPDDPPWLALEGSTLWPAGRLRTLTLTDAP